MPDKSSKITIADIAAKLELSPTTVSFVLNGRDKGISEATRQAVLAAAAELGYRKPGSGAVAPGWLRAAFVTPRIERFNFETSFFANVYQELQKRSQAERFDLFLLELDPGRRFAEERKHLEEFRAIGIELCLAHSEEVAGCLMAAGFPTILVQGGVLPDCVCIYCDDYEAGRLAARHALEMGHRRAGMIFPDARSPRFRGFLETFRAGGGRCRQQDIWTVSFRDEQAAARIEEHTRGAEELPTLFYCFADNLVFAALRGFSRAGFRVPEEISLIGTDNLYWGAAATPAFTTVDLNETLFAAAVIQAMRQVKAGAPPYQQAIPVRLIGRETVRSLLLSPDPAGR